MMGDAMEKSGAKERLGELRREIDAIDEALVALLNRRAGCSLEVGQIKQGSGDCVFKPLRELQVMERLLVHADALPERHLRAIYREIFSSSRRLQHPQRVAYLGPEGTFSYFAGIEFLGHSADYMPQQDLEGVFRAVNSGECGLGVVPLENSLHGTVGQSLDLFLRFDVRIQSELYCKISHSVLGAAQNLGDVKRVYSHPQPLAQCARWLRGNLPNAVLVPVESTAAAASRVQDDPEAVAIGHKRLGDIFDLNVLVEGIEDLPDNWTRFVVIGQGQETGEGRDKTSLLFTLPDKPGALSGVLDVFTRYGVNMKKLESRPMRGEKWKYVFFVDAQCDLERSDFAHVLTEVEERSTTMRILGCYPEGESFDVSSQPGPDAP